MGNILGYLSGYVKLPQLLPFFGNTQFKGLCVIASIALGSTIAISSLTIPERDPRLEGPPRKSKSGVMAFFRQVFKSIRRLPPQIRAVCQVQFFAWVGWFPFLFYITTYIGQLCQSLYPSLHLTSFSLPRLSLSIRQLMKSKTPTPFSKRTPI